MLWHFQVTCGKCQDRWEGLWRTAWEMLKDRDCACVVHFHSELCIYKGQSRGLKISTPQSKPQRIKPSHAIKLYFCICLPDWFLLQRRQLTEFSQSCLSVGHEVWNLFSQFDTSSYSKRAKWNATVCVLETRRWWLFNWSEQTNNTDLKPHALHAFS